MSASPRRRALLLAAAALTAAGGATLTLLLGATESGCGYRSLTIEISEAGRGVVSANCREYDKVCKSLDDRLSCVLEPGCNWVSKDTGCVADSCGPGDASFHASYTHSLKVLLFQRTPLTLRAVSDCQPIEPCDSDGGLGCEATHLNDAIARAIPQGLSYDGFVDRASMFPVLAIYQGDSTSCDGSQCNQSYLQCPTEQFVGCWGLAPPVVSAETAVSSSPSEQPDPYDITCASCQGGLSFALGTDTSPCPTGGQRGKCFFEVCLDALKTFEADGGAGAD